VLPQGGGVASARRSHRKHGAARGGGTISVTGAASRNGEGAMAAASLSNSIRLQNGHAWYICGAQRYTLYRTGVQRRGNAFMKIIGYCALWAVVLALFIAMCAILRDSIITHDISVRGQATDSEIHTTGTATASAISPKQQ
jgi:hypothetical protein